MGNIQRPSLGLFKNKNSELNSSSIQYQEYLPTFSDNYESCLETRRMVNLGEIRKTENIEIQRRKSIIQSKDNTTKVLNIITNSNIPEQETILDKRGKEVQNLYDELENFNSRMNIVSSKTEEYSFSNYSIELENISESDINLSQKQILRSQKNEEIAEEIERLVKRDIKVKGNNQNVDRMSKLNRNN